MLTVNIVGTDNGAGLSRDARLVGDCLRAAGLRTTWSKSFHPRRFRGALPRAAISLLGRYDINLFLERYDARWFVHARRNVLIPNPEWFMDSLHADLGGIDHVLCKSRQAEHIFSRLGKDARWIGFTGEDRFSGQAAAAAPMRALHLAGRSIFKGTDRVVSTWRQRPDWPMLTVVQRPHGEGFALDTRPAPNIRFITERLNEERALSLQREHPLHVLPSEVEGYGQVLAEAMGVGAIVLTTDAAPMNELVQPGRGLVVPTDGAPEAMQLGWRVYVNETALAAAVDEVLGWTPHERSVVGLAARQWFLDNDQRFRADLPAVIQGLAADLSR